MQECLEWKRRQRVWENKGPACILSVSELGPQSRMLTLDILNSQLWFSVFALFWYKARVYWLLLKYQTLSFTCVVHSACFHMSIQVIRQLLPQVHRTRRHQRRIKILDCQTLEPTPSISALYSVLWVQVKFTKAFQRCCFVPDWKKYPLRTCKNLGLREFPGVKVAQSSDSLWLHRLWNSLGQNNGVGSLFLLQGIFPTQELNPGLPHCGRIL